MGGGGHGGQGGQGGAYAHDNGQGGNPYGGMYVYYDNRQ